jgi:hypothetical protein
MTVGFKLKKRVVGSNLTDFVTKNPSKSIRRDELSIKTLDELSYIIELIHDRSDKGIGLLNFY